jgi:hypothetical protein
VIVVPDAGPLIYLAGAGQLDVLPVLHRVLFDETLASLYCVEVKALNQAVSRNIERFPGDFMFQLTSEEERALRSQTVTSNVGRGGRRYLPHAFTEQGVAMLSSVLRSRRAVQVNIEIMRAFVRLRQMMQDNHELSRRLTTLERKYDAQFKVVSVETPGDAYFTPPFFRTSGTRSLLRQ